MKKETAKKFYKDDSGNIWEHPEPRMVFTAPEIKRKKEEMRKKLIDLQERLKAVPQKQVPDEETLRFWQEYHGIERQTLVEQINHIQSRLAELEDADKL